MRKPSGLFSCDDVHLVTSLVHLGYVI